MFSSNILQYVFSALIAENFIPTQNKAVRSQEVPAGPLTPVLRGQTQEMGEEEEDSN